MANVRTVLSLTPAAVAVIEKHAPSVNKKGEWVSHAVTEYARIMAGMGDMVGENDGLLERIDSRLARIEKMMAARSTEK